MTAVRLTYSLAQPLVSGYSNVRVSVTFGQVAVDAYPNIRLNNEFVQPVVGGYSAVRLTDVLCQALFPVPPEYPVPDTTFPGFGNSSDPAFPAGADPASSGLPGLAFSVHKRPMFKTKISEASSGNEVRTSYTQFPRWEFDLSYEFLEDKTANSSLKLIMGFFTDMQGSFGSFLFKDPDDYKVTQGVIGTGDGFTPQFYLARNLGLRGERIGKVDTANPVYVYLTVEEDYHVPNVPGPYTITVQHAADLVEDLGVTGSGVTYTEANGVYTFPASFTSIPVTIKYRYKVPDTDYSVVMPNKVLFEAAPPEGAIVEADFQFFFVCRFKDDEQDYEKFMDKLWSLQTCEFKSILT